jgi:acyl-ACP thioesterase
MVILYSKAEAPLLFKDDHNSTCRNTNNRYTSFHKNSANGKYVHLIADKIHINMQALYGRIAIVIFYMSPAKN